MKCHLFFSFIFKVYVVSLYTFEKLLFFLRYIKSLFIYLSTPVSWDT